MLSGEKGGLADHRRRPSRFCALLPSELSHSANLAAAVPAANVILYVIPALPASRSEGSGGRRSAQQHDGRDGVQQPSAAGAASPLQQPFLAVSAGAALGAQPHPEPPPDLISASLAQHARTPSGGAPPQQPLWASRAGVSAWGTGWSEFSIVVVLMSYLSSGEEHLLSIQKTRVGQEGRRPFLPRLETQRPRAC